ncbi:MAG: serine hydrolase [Burkholderiaceae bacterium]|nr:serine hydrolase [Burkholderiaceae bacterium]
MTDASLMQGFPPAPAEQVTLANWRQPPFNRWAFQHVRELVPSADIANDPDAVWALPEAPLDWSTWSLAEPAGAMSLQAWQEATDTDGLVVMHRGRIVGEWYANGMTEHTPHILMSVSKSMLGLMATQLIDIGVLDPSQPVTTLIPELAGTAYRGATLRHLLDMRVGVLFDEDYLATSGPIIEYRKAQNWNPLAPGDTPSDLRSFFSQLVQPDGPHEGRFHYVSPNTDLLGWVIERATGRRFADLVSECLWQPLGAERPAYITVDRSGAPRCAGGFCATTRDLARVGQLLVQDGRRDGRQIVPAAAIRDLESGGDAAAWNGGDFVPYFDGLPIRYRNQWYALQGDPPMLFGVGVFGQHLFVDRARQIVIAKFASQALPLDGERLRLTLRGVAAIRAWLG